MADVQLKLEEARYFLDLMRRNQDPRTFRFQLNGFLGAFRSVTLRIERAVAGDSVRKARYQAESVARGFPQKVGTAWQAGSDPVLDLLKSERDIDVHQRTVALRTQAAMTVSATATATASVSLQVIRRDGTHEPIQHFPGDPPPPPPGQPTTVTYTWYFTVLPSQEVVPACDHAVQVLSEFLADCQAQGIS